SIERSDNPQRTYRLVAFICDIVPDSYLSGSWYGCPIWDRLARRAVNELEPTMNIRKLSHSNLAFLAIRTILRWHYGSSAILPTGASPHTQARQRGRFYSAERMVHRRRARSVPRSARSAND